MAIRVKGKVGGKIYKIWFIRIFCLYVLNIISLEQDLYFLLNLNAKGLFKCQNLVY